VSGKAIRDPLWHRDEISALTFSRDGKRLATASADGQLVIWNPDTSQSVAEIWPSSTRITALAFSPDGSRIATGGDDRQVRLWDVETGEPVTESLAHTGPIRGLFFQSDGRLRDSVSAEGAIRIWDIQTPSSPGERKALAGFALTISNAHLQSSNRVEWHPLGTVDELRTQAREFDLGAVGVLTRWWFSDPTERLITPFATTTVSQYIAARLAEGTPDSLREATLLAGGNPTLRTAVARASSR
jgi:WD40 repeat protein